MSSFKSKVTQLKEHLAQQPLSNTPCQPTEIRLTTTCQQNLRPTKDELSFQQPIIIERKTVFKAENDQSLISQAKRKKQSYNSTIELKKNYKKVEPFVPVNLPIREKKIELQNISVNTAPSGNNHKEIQIQIEKDDKNKECLKKLFKKVRKLQEDLKESQKERVRLNLQLQNYKGRSKICNEHDKIIGRLEGDKYKLQVELDACRKLLKDRDDQVARLIARVPKEIIKEIIVQKPVQVIVEVPKIVQGPERIVEKIVEVPKYIEVEKKVPFQVIKQVTKDVIKTVQVPSIVQRPIYIDKPIYIDRPYEVQRRVEVPVQVIKEVPVEYPVYIDKPIVDEEWLLKIRQQEGDLQALLRQNAMFSHENTQLKIRVSQLAENLQIMRRHNEQKNREVQLLLQNSIDYLPYSPTQEQSLGSVKYSFSSNPHPRII